jgi:hypothetical protein
MCMKYLGQKYNFISSPLINVRDSSEVCIASSRQSVLMPFQQHKLYIYRYTGNISTDTLFFQIKSVYYTNQGTSYIV